MCQGVGGRVFKNATLESVHNQDWSLASANGCAARLRLLLSLSDGPLHVSLWLANSHCDAWSMQVLRYRS